jgi:polyisoprenyl-phosphate glycosyltransferase
VTRAAARADDAPLVSFVFPVFDEEGNLPELRRRLEDVFRGNPAYRFEIFLVDDHSRDRTADLCREWARADSRVRYLRFSRNFGSHAACRAGLERARGDAAIVLAADLQDPPEEAPRLLDAWRGGARVVWAVRMEREGETLSRRISGGIYWWVMRNVVGVAHPPAGADFFLVDRRVIEILRGIRERNASLLALICWSGFRQAEIGYVKRARTAGRSGWTLRKKVTFFIDSVAGFSLFPVRALSLLGVATATAGTAYSVVLVWLRLRGAITAPGWTTLMVISLIGFGIVMVMVGILGEYLWRALDEVRGRPGYVVEEEAGTGA